MSAEHSNENSAVTGRAKVWRECVAAWVTVSVVAAAVEARRALAGQTELLSAGEQRATFLWALLIQLILLGVVGAVLQSLLRLAKYPPRRWRAAFPPFLVFAANATAVALFLPVGLYVNVKYLGAAFEISSLLGTLGVFLACLIVAHLAFATLGRLIHLFLQNSDQSFYRAAAIGIVGLSILQGLFLVRGPTAAALRPPSKPDAPNLLLLTLDTTRADHTLPTGERGRRLCPNLNRFFADGTTFTRAYVPIPNTIASHATIFTGLYPSSHGVHSNQYRLDENIATLAEILQAQGYRTAAFVSSFVLEPGHSGMQRGFELYDHNFFHSRLIPGSVARLTVVYILSGLGLFDLLERDARTVTDSALAWLEQAKEPFFLWVHYWDPHRPYAPPEPFAAQSDPDYLGDVPLDTYGLMHRPDSFWEARPRDAEHLGRLYAAEVRFMDEQIGRLFDALQRERLQDSTLVLAIADHGEALGETGRFFKHSTLYEFDVRVPLYLKIPPALAQGQSVHPLSVDEVVESVDLLPTLLELLELERAGSYALQGKSLLPLLGEPGQRGPGRAFLECGPWQGLVLDDWKWVMDDEGRERLYHLASDPMEQQDVREATPARAAALKADYESILSAIRSLRFDSEPVTDPEALRRLEQLGYLTR